MPTPMKSAPPADASGWTCGCSNDRGRVLRHRPGCEEEAEYDREIAAMSTWGACCCGFDHVPGCKVRELEVILVQCAIGAAAVFLIWWLV